MNNVRPLAISVVVPVLNEEKNLSACLSALKHFQEIIVVDSGSTDTTCEIALSAGAKVLQFSWNGRFPKKRNWVLQNHDFQTDWVLFIDADEVVDKKFCDELGRAIDGTRHAGFWINYTNYFMGKRLRHGVPQRKLACFKIGAGEYERIEEESWSNLDMEVHEHPILNGSVGEIGTSVDHRDFRGLARFLERHIQYANWEAGRFSQIQARRGTSSIQLTERQKFKYSNLERPWFSWFYFLYTYFFRFGFLDGKAGYRYALYKKWYFQTIRNLIQEQADRS